jgi:hypothetical protein
MKLDTVVVNDQHGLESSRCQWDVGSSTSRDVDGALLNRKLVNEIVVNAMFFGKKDKINGIGTASPWNHHKSGKGWGRRRTRRRRRRLTMSCQHVETYRLHSLEVSASHYVT